MAKWEHEKKELKKAKNEARRRGKGKGWVFEEEPEEEEPTSVFTTEPPPEGRAAQEGVSPQSTGQAELAQKILEIAKQVQGDPNRFTSLENEPKRFAEEVLGVHLWKKQVEILESTLKHRRIAVKSGHSVGKTFVMAVLVLFWLYARKGLVVTTAPTKENVEDVLWRQIHELVNNARVPLPGTKNITEIRVDNTWYAVGLTTAKEDALRGRHHPRLLVIVDEATGVPEPNHLAISTLATDTENVVVMISNPTSTSGTFFEAFKHPDIWHPIQISCMEHPNVVTGKRLYPGAVTREWVEERRTLWGVNHPFWHARVLGEFPKFSNKGVIPLAWVERAQNEERRLKALEEARASSLPRIGGMDVARYGDNNTVIIIRRGDAVEKMINWHHTSLTESARRASEIYKEWDLKHLIVDASGLGAGVADILLDQGLPIVAYNGGHSAFTRGTYANKRSELWWLLRYRLENQRLWLPSSGDSVERLVSDLIAPEYEVRVGRLAVETKEHMLDNGKTSPDWADALVECFALDGDPESFLKIDMGEGRDPVVFEPLPLYEDAPFNTLPYGF